MIVFLHGFGGGAFLWRWQMAGDFLGRPKKALDLPGHGGTPWHHESLSAMAEGVCAALERDHITKAVFVANSFGGLVALKIWQLRPCMVEKIVFVSSLPRFTQDAGYPAGLNVEKIKKLSHQLEGNSAPVLDMFFRSLFTRGERESGQYARIKSLRQGVLPPDKEALQAFLNILETTDLRDVFSSLDVPVQVILGDSDNLCPLKVVEPLKQLLPTARIDVMKGAGHFPFLSMPKEFNDLVRGFVS
ncbi:MAG: alpha/beta fold hydrolase [Candidatus Omnitrophica bacterium]|nr:alpha/beta fold hydrolase [Candidatus Omnitrophota bacterium]